MSPWRTNFSSQNAWRLWLKTLRANLLFFWKAMLISWARRGPFVGDIRRMEIMSIDGLGCLRNQNRATGRGMKTDQVLPDIWFISNSLTTDMPRYKNNYHGHRVELAKNGRNILWSFGKGSLKRAWLTVGWTGASWRCVFSLLAHDNYIYLLAQEYKNMSRISW